MTRNLKGYPGLYREVSGESTTRFRILISHNKKIIQEYFYFRDEASEKAASKAALSRWKEIRQKIPVLTRRKFMEVLRKPTVSGIPGVNRVTTYPRGYMYDVWKANWTNRAGNRKSKQFSINKYGYDEAKRLAIETRREALDRIASK
jgi:hypothetical protein